MANAWAAGAGSRPQGRPAPFHLAFPPPRPWGGDGDRTLKSPGQQVPRGGVSEAPPHQASRLPKPLLRGGGGRELRLAEPASSPPSSGGAPLPSLRTAYSLPRPPGAIVGDEGLEFRRPSPWPLPRAGRMQASQGVRVHLPLVLSLPRATAEPAGDLAGSEPGGQHGAGGSGSTEVTCTQPPPAWVTFGQPLTPL